jgi:hypothetical protein
MPGLDYQIYRLRSDGSGRELFIDDYYSKILSADQSWLYYRTIGMGSSVKRIHTESGEKQDFLDNDAYDLILAEDWSYYTNYDESGKIYRVRIDGSENTLISEDKFCSFLIKIGDWIYYQSGIDDDKIYRVSIDGLVREKINDDQSWWLQIASD